MSCPHFTAQSLSMFAYLCMHFRLTGTCMHTIHFHSFHSCMKPVSLTLGSTLSRQSSVACQRQHFSSRAPPSAHSPTIQTDDSYTHCYDPSGTPRHTHTHTPSDPSRIHTPPSNTTLIQPPLVQSCGGLCRSTPSSSACGVPVSVDLKCVCVYLLGPPPGSQLSTPVIHASPTQDIWVLRSSPTGKSVWSQIPACPPLPIFTQIPTPVWTCRPAPVPAVLQEQGLCLFSSLSLYIPKSWPCNATLQSPPLPLQHPKHTTHPQCVNNPNYSCFLIEGHNSKSFVFSVIWCQVCCSLSVHPPPACSLCSKSWNWNHSFPGVWISIFSYASAIITSCWRMNWLEFPGQRSRSLWSHKLSFWP